jgi:hypothetical protein
MRPPPGRTGWLPPPPSRPLPPAAAAEIVVGQSPCGAAAVDLLDVLVGHGGGGGPPLTSTGGARRAGAPSDVVVASMASLVRDFASIFHPGVGLADRGVEVTSEACAQDAFFGHHQGLFFWRCTSLVMLCHLCLESLQLV